jgi:hypothetical protein
MRPSIQQILNKSATSGAQAVINESAATYNRQVSRQGEQATKSSTVTTCGVSLWLELWLEWTSLRVEPEIP